MRFQCAPSVRGSGGGQNAMAGSALVKSEKPNARMLTGGSANLSLCVARERAKFLQHSLSSAEQVIEPDLAEGTLLRCLRSHRSGEAGQAVPLGACESASGTGWTSGPLGGSRE